jgi:hypothetical protein
MSTLSGGLVPRVVTDMRDARTELDDRLRTVIGDLVDSWAIRMTSTLSGSANGEVPKEHVRGRPPTARKSSTTASEDDAAKALRVREAVEREIPLIRRKMDEYIHDRRTRDMLLRAVFEDVVVKYGAWLDTHGLGTQPGKASTRGKGKGRDDGVWEEEAFGEWAEGAFGLEDGEGEGDGLDLE